MLRMILIQNKYYSFCKQLGKRPSTNYAMSKKEKRFKMGIGNVGGILASALFFLNLPVALARAPGKITYESGGRVEGFACMDIGQCNYGRVGKALALLEEGQKTINGASNAKGRISCQVL
jgi:hypothetical protein